MLRAEAPVFLQKVGHRLSSVPQEFKLPSKIRLSIGAGRAYMISTLAILGGGAGLEVYQTFAGNTPTVEAAEPAPCKVRTLLVDVFPFIKNPMLTDKNGTINPRDYVVGEAIEAGQAIAKVGDDEARANLIIKSDHSEVVFRNLDVKSNVKGQNGKPAAEVSVSFASDKVRQVANPALPPDIKVIIECGSDGVAIGGRYATEDAIIAAAKATLGINSVGARVDQLSEQLFGKGRSLGVTPVGDSAQKNLENLRAKLEEAKKQAQEVRAAEKKAVDANGAATKDSTAGLVAAAVKAANDKAEADKKTALEVAKKTADAAQAKALDEAKKVADADKTAALKTANDVQTKAAQDTTNSARVQGTQQGILYAGGGATAVLIFIAGGVAVVRRVLHI